MAAMIYLNTVYVVVLADYVAPVISKQLFDTILRRGPFEVLEVCKGTNSVRTIKCLSNFEEQMKLVRGEVKEWVIVQLEAFRKIGNLRLDLEDSDIKVSFVAESQPKSVEGGCSVEKRKNKRRVIDDFETE
ncbi:hypothetical protein Tco_0810478 [Tanacetum coccineum]